MNLRKKIDTSPLVCNLLITLFFACVSYEAFAGLFGSDEEIIWESGKNLYIKLVEQENSGNGKTPPNDHPVDLTASQLTNALKLIEFWNKKGFFSGDEQNRVFTESQAQLLGNYLSQGLKKAKPDQDIVFVLTGLKGTLFKDKIYMAGRAFYHENRLHIIIGDYDQSVDKGAEAVAGGAGITEIQHFFTTGRRAKPSSDFKGNIITGDGIEAYTQGNKRRLDWIMINVPVAASAYVAKTEKKENPAGVDSEAIRLEAAKLAKERREMRAEMAKMRKEMNESRNNNGEQLTIEERLAELDELHKKNLISDAEYDQKRKEILDDI